MVDNTPQSTIEADDQLRTQLGDLVAADDKLAILRLGQEAYSADFAEALNYIDIDEAVAAFRAVMMVDKSKAAEILIELDPFVISQFYPHFTTEEWAFLLSELSDDDQVVIFEVFDEDARHELISRLPRQDKLDVQTLLRYPEESAGRIMTTEFIAMDEDATIGHAIERVRHSDLDPNNLFFVYVTKNKQLVGLVSLRRLLVNPDHKQLKDIMRIDIAMVNANTDQEEVAEIVRRRDDVSVPVVDDANKLVGIITFDDIIDVIDEESEEDIYKYVGTSDEELMVADKTHKIVMLRLPWIMAAFFGSLLLSMVMKVAESDIFNDLAGKIFIFVPLICAMGGNVGVQSATIMARMLTTGNPDWREARRSIWKEAKVGLSLGLICGSIVGVVATYWGGPRMLITVMTAMVCAMTTAASSGAVIPVVMKRIGFDPALATGPFVTSFNDLLATIVYFGISFSVLVE